MPRLVVVRLAVPLAALVALTVPLRSQTVTPTVTVDFAAPWQVNSASGLLFGTSPGTPPQQLAPIRPRLWRYADYATVNPTTYYSWTVLAQAFHPIVPDVVTNFLLAQTWGFPVSNWNGVNGPPWQNWTAYETHLRNLVRMLRDANLKTGIFEVWNEPDFPDFWNGTRAQFHETYRRAYAIIRAELGSDALVGGPSIGVYNHADLEAFLEYCLANGCEVNALIFHANDDSPPGIAAYPGNVQDARKSFVDNPRYAPLKIRHVVNNEIGGPIYTRQPAGTLAHYAGFEAGGATYGARSCWNDSVGQSECFNGTMDGLLTRSTLQPRAVWWAQKLYVDGVATRTASTVNGTNLVALASRSTATEDPQILIGHVDFSKTLNSQPGSLSPRLVVNNVTSMPRFGAAFRVAVRIESIPATGEAALAAPILKQTLTVSLVAGAATFALPAMSVGEVFRVTLQPVNTPAPTVALDRMALRIGTITSNGVATAVTSPQLVRLSQTGDEPITWSAVPTQPWLSVVPTSGTGPAVLSIGLAPFAQVPDGTSTAAINFSFTGTSNTAGPISVTVTAGSAAQAAGPFGSFDTPLQNATGVAGSIPVTGWALDDIEVVRVEIHRDPVGTEGGRVFVGTAVLVDGARPDVAAEYPTVPRNTRGGWGYLLLTNMLPSQGNGTFTLHAVAIDAEGQQVLLGSRTITCENAASTAPFGAIDTPEQGQTVSGIVNNFGWVLAPGNARADVPGGGSVTVVIDGEPAGTPIGWTNRADLTATFPAGYSSLSSALAVYAFDSRLLANGVHTIAWVVTATNGQTAGIGSRYFTVANASASVVATIDAIPSSLRVDTPPQPAQIDDVPLDGRALLGRVGWDDRVPANWLTPDRTGRVTIEAEELGLVEMDLAAEHGESLAGYLRVAGQLSPLPIGARLDRVTGRFTWQPGVGFLGAYDLVFVRGSAGRSFARHDVRVVLRPKDSRAAGPRVVIDAPSFTGDAMALRQPFVLAGWAIDRDAAVGTGVSSLHVWAYPVGSPDRTDPVFLGTAEYGGLRADVAAIFGERFRGSGYGLTVTGLPPGAYDLAVFAWSNARQDFVPATLVRVNIRE
jgi:hypothetical protein